MLCKKIPEIPDQIRELSGEGYERSKILKYLLYRIRFINEGDEFD
jgi:hypothetical protein